VAASGDVLVFLPYLEALNRAKQMSLAAESIYQIWSTTTYISSSRILIGIAKAKLILIRLLGLGGHLIN
jgi:hypothetical protein